MKEGGSVLKGGQANHRHRTDYIDRWRKEPAEIMGKREKMEDLTKDQSTGLAGKGVPPLRGRKSMSMKGVL